MAITVTITSSNATLTNLTNFSVQEDATPIEPSSSFGGVGVITIDAMAIKDAPMLVGAVTMVAGTAGKTSGYITSMSGADGNMSIVSDSAMAMYNTSRTVPPFSGTLVGAINFYSDLVGIVNDIVVDPAVSSRPVVYPGWTGNVWVFIKQILVVEQVEMSLVFDRIYVRPLRLLNATLNRAKALAWSVDNADAAQTVEIYYYNNVYGVQQEVYPLISTPEEENTPSIYTVNAGETQTFEVQLHASLLSANQPVMQTYVANTTFPGTNGVYSVTGNDNLPITAAQWNAQNGSLSVRITDDPSIIEVTIRGADMVDYAPYRIAMSSGSGNDYNSLHITGTGVTWNKKMIVIPTGAPASITSDVAAATVDSPFISTYTQALSLGIRAAQAHAGTNYQITGTALDVNRDGAGVDLIQSTILDFNAKWAPGTTVATFNAAWVGQTIAAFNVYWQDRVDVLFSNQLFGNAIGARILTDDTNFRINTVTTTPSEASFSATLDTLISDFNSKWSTGTKTVAAFSAQFVGRTVQDFAIIPLRRV